MDLIVKCNDQTNIYEDGDYWVLTDENGKVHSRIPKERNPYYPVSAVTKYNCTPVNINRLKELNEQLTKALKTTVL